jgi:3-deoxy-manno-octulosonate cytidylyltransferase (CMP-KDO synthetase)
MDVICVLPARLSSTRIPKKLLSRIAGRPLLEWAWRAANRVNGFDRIVVATDSREIEECVRAFDGEVLRTRPDHTSGTDRVEEAAEALGADDDAIIVNFQSDEPFADPATVQAAIGTLAADGGTTSIATLAAPILTPEEFASPGVVKVARAADGSALYFSRSPIPHLREGDPVFGVEEQGGHARPYLRHIGIYAYRRPALRRWASLPESRLESIEKLEQLRALEDGMRIHVEVGPPTEPGVDLPDDLVRAERVLTVTSW